MNGATSAAVLSPTIVAASLRILPSDATATPHPISHLHVAPLPLNLCHPRVSSDKATQHTKHRRSVSLQVVREVISGGSSTAQFAEEARTRSAAEREALSEGLQGGMKVVIPASESLALKADLILPWHKMRIVRRYMNNIYEHDLHVYA